jgi:hypothetical protein
LQETKCTCTTLCYFKRVVPILTGSARNNHLLLSYRGIEKGARNVNIDFHGKFSPLKSECCTSAELLKYRNPSKSGVGDIVNKEDKMKLVEAFGDAGMVCCKYKEHSAAISRMDESNVQEEIIKHLNQVVLPGDNCKSEILHAQATPNHLCEFKGGGDILIQHEMDGSRTILTLGGDNGANEDEEDNQDEVRARSRIELKHQPRETELNIQYQLRANMVLGLSEELHKLLTFGSLDSLMKLNTMTIYGVSFGYRSPLLILKLTVNFSKWTTETSLRYSSSTSHSWAVDSSIAYVVKRMKAKSVDCQTPDSTPVSTPILLNYPQFFFSQRSL